MADLTIISFNRKRAKFTTHAKVTLTAFSIIGFIGGWNLIGRMESQKAQAGELPAPSKASSSPALPRPTPRPTLPPLAGIPPIPTLDPALTNWQLDWASPPAGAETTTNLNPGLAPAQIAPLPTLPPLPTLAPLPAMPAPPPPPPPAPAGGGGNHSGGS